MPRPANPAEPGPAPPRPMLARPFTALREEDYPVFAQPKLNGVRAIADAHGLWSRFGRRLRGLDHIEAALAPVFALDATLVLDGELYAHAFAGDLAATLGALRTGGGPLAFHAFDLAKSCMGVEDRADLLEDAFAEAGFGDAHSFVRRVTAELVEDDEDLAAHYARCLAAGYEGQVVRREGFYAFGRRAILKRKPWRDAEFEVARIDHGATADYAVCRSSGGTFRARVAGDAALKAAAPHLATIRFAGLSRAGKPFDASVIAFHGASRSL